jgi:hypothetical protein
VCFAIIFSFLMTSSGVVSACTLLPGPTHRNDGGFIPNHTGSGFFFARTARRDHFPRIGVCFAIIFSFLMTPSRILKVYGPPRPIPVATMGLSSRTTPVRDFFCPAWAYSRGGKSRREKNTAGGIHLPRACRIRRPVTASRRKAGYSRRAPRGGSEAERPPRSRSSHRLG